MQPTMQMILQRAKRHKFINKKTLVSISTVSNQIDKVRMMQETEHKNLNKKFSVSLKPIPV